MALTKAQVSLVTVATLGAAPGGFTADLLNFGSQVEVAALALSVSPTQAAQSNAEFVNSVVSNLGVVATSGQKAAFLKALNEGTSRADATVDFANVQLVEHGTIANVETAFKSTSTSTDLNELVKVVSGTATESGLTVKFEDNELNQTQQNITNQTIGNVGKNEVVNGTTATKLSSNYTFELKNQIGEEDTFNGLFLSPILNRDGGTSSGSQLFLELLDARYEEGDKDGNALGPLERVPVDTFAFSMGGVDILIQSDKIFTAKTYDDLLIAIQERIEELGNGIGIPTVDAEGNPAVADSADYYAKLANFKVTSGDTFEFNGVTGTQIVLTDESDKALKLEGLGFINKAGVIPQPGYTLYAQLHDVRPTESQRLISTNLDADNVGYGSQGASVNLAGQSASDKGVEEIKVLATNGVWFSKLESKAATNHLARIELKSGSEDYFRVGTQKNHDRHVVDLVEQQFATHTSGTGTPADPFVTTKGAGLVDVQQVDAVQAGSTAINSFISEDVLGRYDLEDTKVYTADDTKAAITYNLSGIGNDVLNLAIDTKVLEAVDTQVTVNTGAGDDFITVMATQGLTDGFAEVIADSTAAGNEWLNNQQLNDNITIDAGAGDDWILTPGAGNATINAGSGNDVVRVDNSGARDVTLFNTVSDDISKLLSNSDNVLSSTTTGDKQTFNFFKAQVQVSFKGFESLWVTIDSSNDYTTNTKQINQAIKAAVNDDPVLRTLLKAYDNAGNALGIEALIDGTAATGVIDIAFRDAEFETGSTFANEAAAKAAGHTWISDKDSDKAGDVYAAAASGGVAEDVSDIGTIYDGTTATVAADGTTAILGAVSAAESDNVINLGAGDDVLVLGTGAESNDTVKVTGTSDNGYNTIVNFTIGDPATVKNADLLDFTYYLTNVDTAGVRVATSITGVSAANGNSVEIVDYLSTETTDGSKVITFDDLTAANVKTMLNDATATGSLASLTIDSSLTSADTQNYVLMVHDKHATAGNEGEYKAFHITSKGDSAEAADVKLIGTFDFGLNAAGTASAIDSITAVNFA